MTRLATVQTRDVPDEGQLAQRQAEAEALEARAASVAAQQRVATEMLFKALTALSQRFVVALANLFGLLTFASAFCLWFLALPEIDTLKIIACSTYSLFVLMFNIYGRRK